MNVIDPFIRDRSHKCSLTSNKKLPIVDIITNIIINEPNKENLSILDMIYTNTAPLLLL